MTDSLPVPNAILGTLPQNQAERSERLVESSGERQASRGTIWTVGGIAPNSRGVDDGHGHWLRSGTNARIFPATFSTTSSRADYDTERYHGRIATALGIDRARRIFEFDHNRNHTHAASSGLVKPCPSPDTIWHRHERVRFQDLCRTLLWSSVVD